jgi:type I restriction enzyme S subunit
MKNWVTKKLDEVCELITCGVAARPQYMNEGIPFLSAKNVKDGQIIWSGYNCVSEQTHKELTKNNKPLVGDILYTRVGSYGEAAVIEDNYEFSVFVSLTLIKVDKSVLNNFFLKHYLNSDFVKRLAKKSISGSGVGNLNVGTVREFPIPLPPLPEQQRIVTILDEAFTAIAKAKANAEQNLRNAKELFESYLQSVFENKGEDWEEKTLGEIADVIGGYSFKSTEFKKEGKYQVLRMGNVRPGIIRENENPVYIDKLDESILKRALLIPNDVIITQTGTKNKRDYGFTVIIEKENYLLNQRISAIRFPKNYLPKFFLYFSWTNNFKDQYFANETGTVGQGNVGINAITNAVVPFLSLTEQQTIVQKLDALSAETKKLESIYQQKINDLEELKKSILQKAFSGELKTDKDIAA